MYLDESVCLGLDIGIGSIGWAMVRLQPDGMASIYNYEGKGGRSFPALGVRTFDVPENPKTKELLSKQRQTAKRQRVTIRRRRWRMKRIRELLEEFGLIGSLSPEQLHLPVNQRQHDPWLLRKKGLDTLLSPEELAVVMLHIAKHRGFKSNSKADKSSASNSETGKMLQAVSHLEERFREAGCRTVGEYMVELPRKRNRAGIDGKPVYERTLLRKLLEDEIILLFEKQREYGSNVATDELLSAYRPLAFDQKPLKSREDLIGYCLFEVNEKRAPAKSYTAERFRLAQKLSTLRLRSPGGNLERIPPQKVKAIVGEVGKKKSLTFKQLKKRLGREEASFDKLNYARKDANGKITDPESKDILGMSGGCTQGSYIFASVLGWEGFQRLVQKRMSDGQLVVDSLAWLFTIHDDLALIEAGMQNLPLEERERKALLMALKEGRFANFRQVAKLSLKAMQSILPHMIDTGDYDLGCKEVGYEHAAARQVDMHSVRNPVVQRIMSEVRRQFKTIVYELGVIPGRVHVELLRDVGKSVEDRNAIKKGLDRRTDEREVHRNRFAELVGKNPEHVSRTELMRYELWKEQGEQCAYYLLWKDHGGRQAYAGNQGHISPVELLDGPNAAQIDHILPRSRTFDNRFYNLCLVRVEANQAKAGRTPYEWIGKDHPETWHVFEEWVRSLRIKGFKKRNYTLKNLDSEMEGKFHERNKHDSSYAAKLTLQWLAKEYEQEFNVPMQRQDGSGIRRIFVRPGRITSDLRRAWGVESLKKDAHGRRIGDRHHALDALLVALCSEGMLQRLTRAYQRMDTWQDKYRLVPDLELPWPDFREDTARLLRGVFVSRKERGKEKGRLHEDTLRQIRQETDANGEAVAMLYERKAVKDLSLKDLDRIKDLERNAWLRDILQGWINAGKPADAPPYSPKGDVIRRVRIKRGPFTSGVTLPRGGGVCQADNASIVRTDVFKMQGKYYLVPVYASQISEPAPPNKAIVGNKNEDEWLLMDAESAFCFTITKNCYVVATKNNGEVHEGYYVGTDRSVAAIVLAAAYDHSETIKVGVKNLKSFDKYRVDRLGNLHLVKGETRTWHGAACT